jgi:type VI secretion system secreted protein VgrG
MFPTALSDAVSELSSAAVSALQSEFTAAFKQTDRLLRLHTPLGPNVLLAESLKGIECISGAGPASGLGQGSPLAITGYTLQIDALSLDAHLELKALIGQPVLLELQTDQSRGVLRPLHGYVTQAQCIGANGGMARYRLTVQPWLAFLGHGRDSAVFQDQTVLQIVQSVFSDYQSAYQGQSPLAPAWRLDILDASVYPKRSLTTQYNESDLQFIERLLLEEGLFYWFEHSGQEHSGDASSASLGQHTLVLADHNGAFKPNARSAIRFSQSKGVIEDDTIDQWRPQRQWHTHAIELASWDYRTLGNRSVTEHAAQDSGVPSNTPVLMRQDTPGAYAYENAQQGQRLAKNQHQAASVAGHTLTACGSVRAMAPGSTFTLTGHANPETSPQAILQVIHHARNNLSAQLKAHTGSLGKLPTSPIEHSTSSYLNRSEPQHTTQDIFYRNAAIVLHMAVPYRAASTDGHGQLIHPKPRVTGSQTALVIGAPGQQLSTDRDHRIKVQFAWQRGSASQSRLQHPAADGHSGAPAQDAPSATTGTWVRVATPLAPIAGANWGSVALPRIGQEVLVSFLGGDIDRPVVVGSLYNGQGQDNQQSNHIQQGAANATGNAPSWFPGSQEANGKGGPLPGHQHNAVLSGIKTQALSSSQSGQGGYNQIVFDDTPGQSRLALHHHASGPSGSHSGASELNLGHLRQQTDNQRLGSAGYGFELKTHHSGAVRSGAGLLISADKRAGNDSGASSHQMDSKEAQSQLQSGQELIKSLSETAQQHKAMLPVLKTTEVKPERFPVLMAYGQTSKSLKTIDTRQTMDWVAPAAVAGSTVAKAPAAPGPCDWVKPGKYLSIPPKAFKKLERPYELVATFGGFPADKYFERVDTPEGLADLASRLNIHPHTASFVNKIIKRIRLDHWSWLEEFNKEKKDKFVKVPYRRSIVFVRSSYTEVIPVYIDAPFGYGGYIKKWPDGRTFDEFTIPDASQVAAALAKLSDQQLRSIARVFISPIVLQIFKRNDGTTTSAAGYATRTTSVKEIKLGLERTNGQSVSNDWVDEMVMHEAGHVTDDIFDITDGAFDKAKAENDKAKVEHDKLWEAFDKKIDSINQILISQLDALEDEELLLRRRYPNLQAGSAEAKLYDEAVAQIAAQRARVKSTARKDADEALKQFNSASAKLNSANNTPAQTESAERMRKWDAAISFDNQWISAYSKENHTEDFAEHYMAYRCAKGTPCEKLFKSLYPNRHHFFQSLEGGKI